MKMVIVIVILVAGSCSTSRAQTHDEKLSSGMKDAFELIKNLSGSWQGSVQWTGAITRKGKMDASYYLTGNGSAVVENLLDHGTPVMTSVYHMDGPGLRVTHYCGTGNQPRLKADTFDPKKKWVTFQFIDITNAPNPDAAHVSGLELQFVNAGECHVVFTFTKAGAVSWEHITLKRTKLN